MRSDERDSVYLASLSQYYNLQLCVVRDLGIFLGGKDGRHLWFRWVKRDCACKQPCMQWHVCYIARAKWGALRLPSSPGSSLPGLATSNQIKGQELQTKIIPLLTFPSLLLSLFICCTAEPRGICHGSALARESSWPHTKGRVLPRVGATGKFWELQRNKEAASRVPRDLSFHSISITAPDPECSRQQSSGQLRAQKARPRSANQAAMGQSSVSSWGWTLLELNTLHQHRGPCQLKSFINLNFK